MMQAMRQPASASPPPPSLPICWSCQLSKVALRFDEADQESQAIRQGPMQTMYVPSVKLE